MTDQALTEIIMKEVSGLPAARQADVLAFVRFVKIGLADMPAVERQFDEALLEARKTARERQITDQDIADEIQAVRAQK
jgi:hypothetical protein